MRKNTWLSMMSGLLFCCAQILLISPANADVDKARTLKIATWNMWDFAAPISGDWKKFTTDCASSYVCTGYSDVIRDGDYDLVFVQEIKGDFAQFDSLCAHLNLDNYACSTTQNMGETAPGNNEGYGIIYKNDLQVVVEYTGNRSVVPYFVQGYSGSFMARPPMKATVLLPSGTKVTVFNNHIKTGLGNVARELGNLDAQISANKPAIGKNIIVLGDLNADGGTNSAYGNGRCNNYYPSGIPGTDVDLTYDDSDQDGDRTTPIPDGSDYYLPGAPTSTPTNFSNSTLWRWIITNGFNLIEGISTDTSQGTNLPNAAPQVSGNRGCVYDRIITSQELANYRYNSAQENVANSVRGVVGTIPYNITNAPTPRGTPAQNSATIPAGTPFKNIQWYGNKGSDVYGISDHKLVWAKFNFGAVSPTDTQANKKSIFVRGETVFFKGAGFLPSKTYKLYVVPYFPVNSTQPYDLLGDIARTVDISFQVNTDDNGNIANRELTNVQGLIDGNYLIIVDLDGDHFYNRDIDVAEYFLIQSKDQKNRTFSVAVANGVGQSDGSTAYKKTRVLDVGQSTSIVGSGITPGLIGGLTVSNYQTGKAIAIIDNVAADASGNFNFYWPSGFMDGIYNMIFHPYDAGPIAYNPQYDVEDYEKQIGFMVTKSSAGYNDLAMISDNGISSAVFNVDSTRNIYVLGKNLPAATTMDMYVVSNKLFENLGRYASWIEAKAQGNLSLSSVAIPTNSADLRAQNITIMTYTSSQSGEILQSVMQNITKDFVDAYGPNFNVINDTNRNGIFDDVDKITSYAVDKIVNCLSTAGCLVSGDYDATLQYQELLNAKLSAAPELTLDGIYGAQTQEASTKYISSQFLDSSTISILRGESEIGFSIAYSTTSDGDHMGNKIYRYINGNFSNVTFSGGRTSIDNNQNLTLNNVAAVDSSYIGINTEVEVNLLGMVNGGSYHIFNRALSKANTLILKLFPGSTVYKNTNITVHEEL